MQVVRASALALQVVFPERFPYRCRFYPSCSAYAIQALEWHGPVRGAWLAVRRLARCHPFHPGGVDKVPDLAPWRTRDCGEQVGEDRRWVSGTA
ncbi:MAG: membrane protein insertion efficiency factor YidD [Egibacteraceae bacterium]